MTITQLVQGKRDRNRVNVYVEGKFWAAIEKSTLADFTLFQGKDVTQEQQEEIIISDSVNFLWRRMLDMWMRRPRAQSELTKKMRELLKRKEVEMVLQDKVITTVLERLQAQGFTDTEFARWFVEARAAQAKYGSTRVAAELRARGISAEVIRQTINSLTDNDSSHMQTLLQKKFGVTNLREITDRREQARAYRWLASRGFRPSL